MFVTAGDEAGLLLAPLRRTPSRRGRRGAEGGNLVLADVNEHDAEVRGEGRRRGILPDFRRLVSGSMDADSCNKLFVFACFLHEISESIRFAHFCTAPNKLKC